MTIPVLWLAGPPGVGKTAVAWEVYRRLARAGAAPAYVDVDQLGMCYPATSSDPDRHRLKARNVASLGASFAAAGARCLIVSGVVDAERGPELDELGVPQVIAVRLRVDPGALRERLSRRQGSGAEPTPRWRRRLGMSAARSPGGASTRRAGRSTKSPIAS